MDSKDMPLSLYGWRPSLIWPKKRVKRVEKFEPYDFLVIWSLMMQYPPLTQFGQTNLANSIFVTSQSPLLRLDMLTHWGRVMHMCVEKLTIIGLDNGLSLERHQAIIWTDAGILLIGPFGTNFSWILIEINTFSFKKMHWKLSSARWRQSCLSVNVLNLLGNWTRHI